MAGCWAEALGDCDGPISGEHIVSRAMFREDHVAVQGFRWCREAPKRVSLNSVTANILCASHNSRLSELDAAAGNAMECFRECGRLADQNKRLMPWERPTIKRLRIDAGRLERWMLKTMLNVIHGSLTTGGKLVPRGTPAPEDLVRRVFGLSPFDGTSGMYTAYSAGMKIGFVDRVAITTILDTHADDEIMAGKFELHGLRFIINLRSTSPVPPFETVPGTDPSWHGSQLSRRFERIRFNHGIWASHYIDFDWSTALQIPPSSG